MFEYLIKKIEEAPTLFEPFAHVEINDFFSAEHFAALLGAEEISLPSARDDNELMELLRRSNYEPIEFPGTANSIKDYLAWRADANHGHTSPTLCEGFGLTFRLKSAKAGSIVDQLNRFFGSEAFLDAIAAKFEINRSAVFSDLGLQKYCSGYEISPHPDVRSKALTYMINVNPGEASEAEDFHTHYMSFTPARAYIGEYWKGNPRHDRCWVPWDWCATKKRQNRNNSLVIFAPSDDTLHAVRANYDHLAAQRTQFYGNLWYNKIDSDGKPSWHDFEIGITPESRDRLTLKQSIVDQIPFKEPLRRVKQSVLGR